MANYAITDYTTGPTSMVNALALLETYLETIDTTKTIYLVSVVHLGGDSVIGAVLHAA